MTAVGGGFMLSDIALSLKSLDRNILESWGCL